MPPIRIEPWSNRSSKFWKRSPEQVEELLSLMHEELDGDGPLEERWPMRSSEAFSSG